MVHKLATSVLVLSLCAVVLSAPAPQEPQQSQQPEVHLVRSVDTNDGSGAFQYTYEQDNGQIVSAAGALKTVQGEDGEAHDVVVITGQYSFVGADGITYWVNYTADENGFHPVVGTGPTGGIQPGQDSSIDPNALKSLIG